MAVTSEIINDLMKGAKEGVRKSYLNKGALNGTVKLLKGNEGVGLDDFVGRLERAASNPGKFGKGVTTESMNAIRDTIQKEVAPQMTNGKLGKNIELGSGMRQILADNGKSQELFKGLGYDFDKLSGQKSLINSSGSLAQNAGAFWGNGIYNSVKNLKAIEKNERDIGSVTRAISDAHSTNGKLDAFKVAGTASSAMIAGRAVNGTFRDGTGQIDLPGVPIL